MGAYSYLETDEYTGDREAFEAAISGSETEAQP